MVNFEQVISYWNVEIELRYPVIKLTSIYFPKRKKSLLPVTKAK